MKLVTKEKLAGSSVALGLFVIIIGVLMLSGCGVSSQYGVRPPSEPYYPAPVAKAETGREATLAPGFGQVPVVIINQSQLIRHIYLFEGREQVAIVPDYKTGGWVFSRPPLAEFKIKSAKDDNWAEDLRISLPRNFSFVVYDQPERFWGQSVGQPNILYGRTGSNPVAREYNRQTPTGGIATAGEVIWLPWVDASGTTSRLRLEYKWNPGAAVKGWLFDR